MKVVTFSPIAGARVESCAPTLSQVHSPSMSRCSKTSVLSPALSLTPDTKALLDDAREELDFWSPVRRQLWCEESGYEACSEKNDASSIVTEDLIRELALSPTKSDRDMAIVQALSPKKITSQASFDYASPNVIEDTEAAKPVQEPIANSCEESNRGMNKHSGSNHTRQESPQENMRADVELFSPSLQVEKLEMNLFSGDLFSPDSNLMMEKGSQLDDYSSKVSTDGDNGSETGFLELEEDSGKASAAESKSLQDREADSEEREMGSISYKVNNVLARVYEGECADEILNLELTVQHGETLQRAINQLWNDLKKVALETKETFQPWVVAAFVTFALYRLFVVLLIFFYGDSLPRTC